MTSLLWHVGNYFILMRRVFTRPDKMKVFAKRFVEEVDAIGINSLGIVAILSVFMGAVILIQTAFGLDNPLMPAYAWGMTTRTSMIMEFSPTIVSLILAGKVGSSIASEIGTMKVTEQIDALEIMGVNPTNYLILPKVIAGVFIIPFLVTVSMILGIAGGYLASIVTGAVSPYKYIYGIQFEFAPYDVVYALIKTLFFAFILTSISAYHGFITRGGALEVGRSSTKAVVYSTIIIVLFDLILTQLLLDI